MGAGQFRGGAGVEVEVKIFPPNASVASRAMERYHFRPWGRAGGQPGSTGYTRLNPDTPGQREIGKIDVLHLEPGDVIRVGTQGGGGYGDPLDRALEKILADVHGGIVSAARARADYGVVTDGQAIDQAATEALRADLRRQRSEGARPPGPFDFGPERVAYERVWTDELRTAVVHALGEYPGRMRTFLMERVARHVEEENKAGRTVPPGAVPGLVTAVLAGLRQR